MRKILALFFLLFLTSCQTAETGLSIGEAWARLGQAGGNSAIYFTIKSLGQDDALLVANSEVAEAVELHETMMMGDQMHMHQLKKVPLPRGQEVVFKPGGLHIMLIGLRRDLKVGDTFELTLVFEKSGEVTLPVTVREP